MSDLVERLKKPAPAFGMEYYDPTFDVRQEAAKRIAELEAALHDAAELAFERRDEAAKAAKRIAELEAALEGERESRALSTGTLTLEVAKRGERIAELEAALRKAIAFYDALETPHALGEPALLDELTGVLQSS